LPTRYCAYWYRESSGMCIHQPPRRYPTLLKLLCAALLVLLVGATGCTTDNSPPSRTMLVLAQEATQRSDEYRIGPQDILEISVWKNPDISRTVVVRPDGMISLPLLNDIQVGGLTAMQLRKVLGQRLAEYIAAPEVSVIVVEPRSAKVLVVGEVQRPGNLELQRPMTVLEALFLAGGLTAFASPKRIAVLRPNGDIVQQIPFNYKNAMSAGGEAENFFLQSGDIIMVP
jgi:polysaccharide biosynthesis/export protein